MLVPAVQGEAADSACIPKLSSDVNALGISSLPFVADDSRIKQCAPYLTVIWGCAVCDNVVKCPGAAQNTSNHASDVHTCSASPIPFVVGDSRIKRCTPYLAAKLGCAVRGGVVQCHGAAENASFAESASDVIGMLDPAVQADSACISKLASDVNTCSVSPMPFVVGDSRIKICAPYLTGKLGCAVRNSVVRYPAAAQHVADVRSVGAPPSPFVIDDPRIKMCAPYLDAKLSDALHDKAVKPESVAQFAARMSAITAPASPLVADELRTHGADGVSPAELPSDVNGTAKASSHGRDDPWTEIGALDLPTKPFSALHRDAVGVGIGSDFTSDVRAAAVHISALVAAEPRNEKAVPYFSRTPLLTDHDAVEESSNATGLADQRWKEKAAPYLQARAIDAVQAHAVGVASSTERFAAECTTELAAELAAEYAADVAADRVADASDVVAPFSAPAVGDIHMQIIASDSVSRTAPAANGVQRASVEALASDVAEVCRPAVPSDTDEPQIESSVPNSVDRHHGLIAQSDIAEVTSAAEPGAVASAVDLMALPAEHSAPDADSRQLPTAQDNDESEAASDLGVGEVLPPLVSADDLPIACAATDLAGTTALASQESFAQMGGAVSGGAEAASEVGALQDVPTASSGTCDDSRARRCASDLAQRPEPTAQEGGRDLLRVSQFLLDLDLADDTADAAFQEDAEDSSISFDYELRMAVESAADLGMPEYRFGSVTRAYTGRGQLKAYVVVEFGSQTQNTSVGNACGGDVDFFGEEMICSVKTQSTPSVKVRVFDKRNWTAMVGGDPMIGEGFLQIPTDLPDGRHHMDVKISRTGTPMGSVRLRCISSRKIRQSP